MCFYFLFLGRADSKKDILSPEVSPKPEGLIHYPSSLVVIPLLVILKRSKKIKCYYPKAKISVISN